MAENASLDESCTQGAEPQPYQEDPNPGTGSYLGSVRFFKHMIVAVLVLLILVTTVLALVFGTALRRTRTELSLLRQSISAPAPELPEEAPPEETGPAEEDPGPEFPAYQSLYPDLYARPAERNSVDTEKVVYLTFDDGPSARTPELLEILECYGVKATFFVVNKDTEQAKQWMRDIVAAGHTLGIHSYSHDYQKIYASVEDYLEDFNAMYQSIQDTTGIAPQIFRFPGGSINNYNTATYQEIISEMVRRGFVYFDWNRQTGDTEDASVRKLVQNAMEGSGNMRRVILLAHDSAHLSNVVKALPQIIEGYQEQGFTFDALTAEVRPVVYVYS